MSTLEKNRVILKYGFKSFEEVDATYHLMMKLIEENKICMPKTEQSSATK